MSPNPKKQAPVRLGNDPFLRGAAPAAPPPVPLADLAQASPEVKAEVEAKTQSAAEAAREARPATKPDRPARQARPTTKPARKARPETKPERPARPSSKGARKPTAESARAVTQEVPAVAQPAEVTAFESKRPRSKGAKADDARPDTVNIRPPRKAKPPTVEQKPAEPERAQEERPFEVAEPEHQGEPEQALVKHVLVPEVEHGEQPPPEPAPEHKGPSPLAMLAQLASKQAQGLLTSLATSPAVLKGAAAAISGGTAVRALLAPAGGTREVDAFGEDAGLVARTAPAVDFLYRHYFRVSAEGTENLPDEGPLLAIGNHAGALPIDGLIVRSALERARRGEPARWLVEDAIFHAPFIGTWLNRLGAVRACPENALRLLETGTAVVVFPEGVNGLTKTFRRRYQLQRFGRGGFVKLALRTGAPLIPTAVLGSEEAAPVLATVPAKALGLPVLPLTPALLPLPTKWFVSFGEPVDLSRYGPDDAHDLALVQRITEEVRSSIHDQLTRLRSARHSVFRG